MPKITEELLNRHLKTHCERAVGGGSIAISSSLIQFLCLKK